jgi:hypothetical protein
MLLTGTVHSSFRFSWKQEQVSAVLASLKCHWGVTLVAVSGCVHRKCSGRPRWSARCTWP